MANSLLQLRHPSKFKTRSLPTKGVQDAEQRTAHKIDNKILSSQTSLAEDVQSDAVSLSTFCDTVSDLEEIASRAASFRPDGFSKQERDTIDQAFSQIGQDHPKKIDPELKALYQQVHAGALEASELTEELNWRTQRAYGDVASERSGPVFQEERYKLRASLHVPRTERAKSSKVHFRHPELDSLVTKAIDLFPRLDTDHNEVVDRKEARSLIAEYQTLGLTPAEATTLYSRQKQFASVVDPATSGEQLRMEDLTLLLSENFPSEPSEKLKDTVTSISKRFRHQLKTETPEPAPFLLADEFQPSNVKQGREGSCWFLCNLPALSQEELSSIITPEQGGYRATLADGRTTFVEPLNEAERRTYSSGDGAWSGLLEKGVSQILSESNQDLNGGYARIGRKMLSGKDSVRHTFYEAQDGLEGPDLRDREKLFSSLEKAISNGSAAFAAAVKSDFDEGISEISAAHHAYTVLDIDRENDTVVVRNPWGRSERADLDGTNNGVFELTQDQFFANFSYIYLDQSPNESADLQRIA